MSRTKKIAVLAIIAMVLTLMPAALFAATATDTRIAGTDRVGTSIEIANAGWTTASTVILAPADQANLVDALAAAPLAGQENAPILLTFKGSLDAAVKAKIAALGATKVYVVGAISDAVAAEVDAMTGVTVEALKGNGRQATAAAVNAKLTSPAGTFVVGYDAIPDALSVASFAAKNKYAIMLANADGTFSGTAVGSTKYIVGGTAKVADISGLTRISGADRFATNKAVADTLTFTYERVYVANGVSLVDALAVAPLAAKYSAFVALASGSDVAAAATVNGKMSSTSKVIAVGGTSAVSDTVKGKVAYTAPSVFAVESITAMNLTQFKVVFNKEVSESDAENTANYKLGTAALTGVDCAVLQADKKTVIVTMDVKKTQNAKDYVTVLAGILSKDGTESTKSIEQEVTFSDVTSPTVASVTVSGNKQLTVNFSEAVVIAPSATGIKIDGTSIGSMAVGTLTNGNAVAPVVNGQTGDEATTATSYSQKLVIPFNVALTAGTHTLTMPTATGTNYVDAAGFRLSAQDISFTIASVTTAPTIVSVTGESNGTVYVEFDREMDLTTATTLANYGITDLAVGANNPTSASFKPNSNNKIVKLTFAAGKVVTGANVLEIENVIVDTYGNKVHATTNQRVSFTAADDTTKPAVTSISLASNATTGAKITVKYSETVDGAYATNVANYKLKDANGVVVASSASGIASITNSTLGAGNDTTFIITLTAGVSPLSSSSYSLELKNVVDIAKTPNRMDTVTLTLTVADTVAPTVSAVYETLTANKVRVVFSENMNSTMTTKANYYYALGNAQTTFLALPSGATVEQIDAKTVEITFPASMNVDPGSVLAADVTNLRIANVYDVAGNLLSGITSDKPITAASAAATVTIDATTINVAKDGTTVKVTFTTNKVLSNIDTAEVLFAGQAPDTVVIAGTSVTLNYTNAAKVDAIKLAGNAATLAAIAANGATGAMDSCTADGVLLTAYAGTAVNDDQLAPEITGVVFNDNAGADTVVVTFSEAIDGTIAGLYKDDFTVESGGAIKTIAGATVVGTNLTLTLATGALTGGVNATLKAVSDKISIKDLAGDVALTASLYVPTDTDLAGRSATIADVVAPTATVAVTSGGGAGTIEAGDIITVTFSENTDKPVLAAGDFTIAGGHIFGVGTTFVWNAAGNVLTITLAGVPSLANGDTIAFAAANTVEDVAGNDFGNATFYTVVAANF